MWPLAESGCSPSLLGGLTSDAETGADLGPGIAVFAQAFGRLGYGGVDRFGQTEHEGQGLDVAVPYAAAVGLHDAADPWSGKDARDTLRAALTCAVEDEVIPRNPVAVIQRQGNTNAACGLWMRRAGSWSHLAAMKTPFYTAYVLILVLGLRKGEVLGLTWDRVDLKAAELHVGEQLQRVTGQLIRRQVKTESSEAPLPLPELCVTALKLRSE